MALKKSKRKLISKTKLKSTKKIKKLKRKSLTSKIKKKKAHTIKSDVALAQKNKDTLSTGVLSLYGKKVGEITHFFNKIKVGVVKLEDNLRVNDDILIRGATTNFKQKVKSMQIDHKPVTLAEKGQEIGLKVNSRVRRGDSVYLQ